MLKRETLDSDAWMAALGQRDEPSKPQRSEQTRQALERLLTD